MRTAIQKHGERKDNGKMDEGSKGKKETRD